MESQRRLSCLVRARIDFLESGFAGLNKNGKDVGRVGASCILIIFIHPKNTKILRGCLFNQNRIRIYIY
jgi:hypothetical protein